MIFSLVESHFSSVEETSLSVIRYVDLIMGEYISLLNWDFANDSLCFGDILTIISRKTIKFR